MLNSYDEMMNSSQEEINESICSENSNKSHKNRENNENQELEEISPFSDHRLDDQESNEYISKKYIKWTKREDQMLKEMVMEMGTKNWEKIVDKFGNKSLSQCIYRWYKVIKPSIRNDDWSEQEDKFLLRFISQYGTKSWTNCAKILNSGRTPKNCKERWYNVLSLKQKNGSDNIFSPKDDLSLLVLVRSLGTCWSKIVKFFPTKKENQIKNRCYSILRKYAIDHINNTSTANLNKVKSLELKTTQMISFLPTAIEGLKSLLGLGVYEELMREYNRKLKELNYLPYIENDNRILSNTPNTHNTPNANSPCTNIVPCQLNKMITINLCNNCKTKLKDQIKKKIYTKMIQNQINSMNLGNCLNNVNVSTNSNSNSNENYEVLTAFSSKLKSTGKKVESIKEMLKSFIESVS